MKPTILLRIASILSLLFCAGHSSGMPWFPAETAEATALVEKIRTYRFEIMGVNRSFWDFHVGFGLIISIDLLVQAVVLWILATMAKNEAARIRPLIAPFALAAAAHTILDLRYFFAIPAISATLIAVCLGLAFALARPSKTHTATNEAA